MLNIRPPLAAASLVFYHNVCGKANCACKAGQTHGPYAYLSYKVKGKTRLKMVAKNQLEQVATRVKRYREFQQVFKRVRKLNREVEGLFKRLRVVLARGGV